MPVEECNLDSNSPDGDKNHSEDGKENQDENTESGQEIGQSKEIHSFPAHKDIIKSIQYIHSTDEPLIFTAGLDKNAYIWDMKG